MQNLLGNLSQEDFLKNYWQQKPLVIRGAFADFEMPFSAEELAGLALDTDAPSRIIVEKGLAPDYKPWTSKHSPFIDEDFISTPKTHWTFLVNDLERYIPELGNLIEPFRFIPDWRIDDLMVSYAADQGSVGPHVDEYDVFLIQGEGKRRWQINTNPDYPKDLIPDTSLAILKEFKADEEWVLEAGDMIYLPPNMPHYGVAEGECFTFSVGFRAPNTTELSQSWIESFSDDKSLISKRYKDAGRKPQHNSAEISADDIKQLSEQILSVVKQQEKQLPIFLGKYLTETRGEITNEEDINDLDVSLEPYQDYERETWLRLAFIKNNDSIDLFANGKHLRMPLEYRKDIEELCVNFYYNSQSLQRLIKNKDFVPLFNELLETGGITPCD